MSMNHSLLSHFYPTGGVYRLTYVNLKLVEIASSVALNKNHLPFLSLEQLRKCSQLSSLSLSLLSLLPPPWLLRPRQQSRLRLVALFATCSARTPATPVIVFASKKATAKAATALVCFKCDPEFQL
jgi:hypothetical protein